MSQGTAVKKAVDNSGKNSNLDSQHSEGASSTDRGTNLSSSRN